jgi:hypothetical protein
MSTEGQKVEFQKIESKDRNYFMQLRSEDQDLLKGGHYFRAFL